MTDCENQIITLISVLAILLSIFPTGCSDNKPEAKKEAIGIIGAMDVEVNTLNEAADITKTTKIAEMEFCE